MKAESDGTRATLTPDQKNTEHHHAKSKPEGRAMTTFNSKNSTFGATRSQLAKERNPYHAVQDKVPGTTKIFCSEKSDMGYKCSRKAKHPPNERSKLFCVTEESSKTNWTLSQPQRTLHGNNHGM